MSKKRKTMFFNRRTIVSLIGIDYDILEKTGHDNYFKFFLTGFLVLLIFVISLGSVFYAFDLMFDMWYAEILLSLFFGLTFCNIYIFLIQTFSKELFPSSFKIRFFNLSNLSRIAFVLFIGFLIAQPVKIFILREQLDAEIDSYKYHQIEEFEKRNAALYESDLKKLYQDRKHFSSQGHDQILIDQVFQINQQISDIEQQIEEENINASVKINRSNFLTKRIIYSSHYKESSRIDFVVLLIFTLPILLIYSISGESDYYKLKKESDRDKVLDHYHLFKEAYQKVFKNKFRLDLTFHEPYTDPPFNTIKKPEPSYSDQENFFHKYLK